MFFEERNVFPCFLPGDIIALELKRAGNRESQREGVPDLPHCGAGIEFATVCLWFILKRERTHMI